MSSEIPTPPTAADLAADRETLKARARIMAEAPQTTQDSGAVLKIVEFRLANERYAVEQEYVREIYPLNELTPVPCTPPFVLGIINVRGQILPVLDVKKFFDLPEAGITDLHVVVIVQAGDVEVGILADVVSRARSIPLDTLQSSLPTLTGIRANYLKGISDEHVIVLDVARILSDPKIVVDEEVHDMKSLQ